MLPMSPDVALPATQRVWAALFGQKTELRCVCHDSEADRQRVAAMALADDLRRNAAFGLSEADEADRLAFASASVRVLREIERDGRISDAYRADAPRLAAADGAGYGGDEPMEAGR